MIDERRVKPMNGTHGNGAGARSDTASPACEGVDQNSIRPRPQRFAR
jgi:hypothetical protein